MHLTQRKSTRITGDFYSRSKKKHNNSHLNMLQDTLERSLHKKNSDFQLNHTLQAWNQPSVVKPMPQLTNHKKNSTRDILIKYTQSDRKAEDSGYAGQDRQRLIGKREEHDGNPKSAAFRLNRLQMKMHLEQNAKKYYLSLAGQKSDKDKDKNTSQRIVEILKHQALKEVRNMSPYKTSEEQLTINTIPIVKDQRVTREDDQDGRFKREEVRKIEESWGTKEHQKQNQIYRTQQSDYQQQQRKQEKQKIEQHVQQRRQPLPKEPSREVNREQRELARQPPRQPPKAFQPARQPPKISQPPKEQPPQYQPREPQHQAPKGQPPQYQPSKTPQVPQSVQPPRPKPNPSPKNYEQSINLALDSNIRFQNSISPKLKNSQQEDCILEQIDEADTYDKMSKSSSRNDTHRNEKVKTVRQSVQQKHKQPQKNFSKFKPKYDDDDLDEIELEPKKEKSRQLLESPKISMQNMNLQKVVSKQKPKQTTKEVYKGVPKEIPKEIPKQTPKQVLKPVPKDIPKQNTTTKQSPKQLPKPKQKPKAYTSDEIDEFIDIIFKHQGTINLFGEYSIKTRTTYQGVDFPWQEVAYHLYRKMAYERERLRKTLNSQDNCFVLTQMEVPTDALKICVEDDEVRGLKEQIEEQSRKVQETLKSMYEKAKAINSNIVKPSHTDPINDVKQALITQYRYLQSKMGSKPTAEMTKRKVYLIEMIFVCEWFLGTFIKDPQEEKDIKDVTGYLRKYESKALQLIK